MSIVGAFMVPHPPLIVPSIGQGREEVISKTIESYEAVAKEIADLKPETIVISSPHAPYYSDYFYLSYCKKLEGSFESFGAPQVSFSEDVDFSLAKEIEKIAKEEGFPTGEGRVVALDHGTMVPLYFIRKYIPSCKILVVGVSTFPLIDHYHMGVIIKKAVSSLKRRVVYVASGDLSHKLQEDGPYGFVEEGPIYDERIMDTCSHARFGELLEYNEKFLEKVSQCGHRSFTMMAGALDGVSVRPKFYSHQDVTGVGYGICSFYPDGEDVSRTYEMDYYQRHLVSRSSDEYVSLAYQTIDSYIRDGKTISVPKDLSKELTEKESGVFVTIHKFGLLRGCIGTFLPTTSSVAKEIIQNAISACSKDPRFLPVEEKELPYLEVHVDVLSPPEDIDSEDELDPKRYGVIVTSGTKRGLLLPDLDGIEDVDTQIKIAKRKANISEAEEITLKRFEVIRHI